MCTSRYLALPLLLLAAATSLAAQQAPRLSGEAVIGLAHRSPANFTTAEAEGFHALARGGLRLDAHLRLVGELSLTRYAGQLLNVPMLCPQPVCVPSLRNSAGLSFAGFAVGLQPHVDLSPIRLTAGATVGGYWLFHHDNGMPDNAPALRGTVGLGLPIGGRVHILLEASALRMLKDGARQADSRSVGIGVGVE